MLSLSCIFCCVDRSCLENQLDIHLNIGQCYARFTSTVVMSKLFLLPSELLTQNDIDRINKMFESPKRQSSKSKSFVNARALVCPVMSEQYYNIWTPEVDPVIIKHEESLMGHRPIVSPRLPAAMPMKYRILTFGVGSTNDVPLDRFGHCNYVSPRHAVIFFDEMERQYELLNYSCYGTYVNNTLAANNETYKYVKQEDEAKIPCPDCPESPEGTECKKRKVSPLRKPFIKKPAMKCSCIPRNFEGLTRGWEGSVPVLCGSVLRFGCISIVFSVTSNSVE